MTGMFGRPLGTGGVVGGGIKGWVRDVLDLSESSTVMVAELACTEPGCPPLETVVAVLDAGATRRYTIHRPMAEITEADVRALLSPTPAATDQEEP